jgi:hypothetical protein
MSHWFSQSIAEHHYAMCLYAECQYGECRGAQPVVYGFSLYCCFFLCLQLLFKKAKTKTALTTPPPFLLIKNLLELVEEQNVN